jgi:hypothetical protein
VLRKFVDSNDVEWQVWDVTPTQAFLERRRVERRKRALAGYTGPERRGSADRRKRLGQGELGWLAFDSSIGRKRLMGIPPDFTVATESQLQAWCSEAAAVPSMLEWKVVPNI